jgi:hypothetical protein
MIPFDNKKVYGGKILPIKSSVELSIPILHKGPI